MTLATLFAETVSIARHLAPLPLVDFIAHGASALAVGETDDAAWFAANYRACYRAVEHAKHLRTAQATIWRALNLPHVAVRAARFWRPNPDGSPRFQRVLTDADYLATIGSLQEIAKQIRPLEFDAPIAQAGRALRTTSDPSGTLACGLRCATALRAAQYGIRTVDRRMRRRSHSPSR
jgi:hypothetical protein